MWKEVIVHVDASADGLARVRQAQTVAARTGAALNLAVIAVTPGHAFGPGAGVVAEARRKLFDEAIANANALKARVESEFGLAATVHLVHPDRTVIDAASLFRAGDLAVIGAPVANGVFVDDDLFDAALFHGGGPALVVPPGAKPSALKSVVIAWKDCREASRAVHDALPLLVAADQVRLIGVRGGDDERFFGQAALDRMLAHLGSHGVPATAESVAAGKEGVGAALLSAAGDADLIVMGAYGHWRMAQRLFGGMTRRVIETARAPLLMSH